MWGLHWPVLGGGGGGEMEDGDGDGDGIMNIKKHI
jgi:hypothetical protein